MGVHQCVACAISLLHARSRACPRDTRQTSQLTWRVPSRWLQLASSRGTPFTSTAATVGTPTTVRELYGSLLASRLSARTMVAKSTPPEASAERLKKTSVAFAFSRSGSSPSSR